MMNDEWMNERMNEWMNEWMNCSTVNFVMPEATIKP